MKKLFLAASLVNAQKVNFGAKAGLNLANLKEKDSDNKIKPGFYVGSYATIKLADKFSFQPELLFSTQGTKIDFLNRDVKLNFNYINIPLMAQYEIVEGLKAEFGPQVGFLVSSKVKVNSISEDIKENFNTLDFGLNFGLNYELKNGFNFGARYGLGLSNISKIDNTNAKNSVISVGIGYTFIKSK